MTKYQFSAKKANFQLNRAVYQNTTPAELNNSESQNLDKVRDVVEKQVRERLELKGGIDSKIKDIQPEIAAHKGVIDKLFNQLKTQPPGEPVNEVFESMGQSIKVVMNSSGHYEEFLVTKEGDKEINFLSWAIQQKQKN